MYNVLVVFGLVFGKLLGLITKEEVKEGKRYFILIERIILVVLFLSLLVIDFSIYSLGIFLGVFIYLILIRSHVFFLGFGVLLASFVSLEFGLLVASLVFLYLLVCSRDLKWVNILVSGIVFVLPFILLLGESFIKGNLSLFLSVSAGGIIGPVAQLGRTLFRKSK
tara:strand:+ start:149 stop:646 length:498 start_codon:yes stop_codon:yes gene_type:complete